MADAEAKAVTDSTCDLSQAEIENPGAVMAPLPVTLGPDIFYSGELSKDEYR